MLEDLFRQVGKYVLNNPWETQVVIFAAILTYYLVVYPFYISPLRNVPGPYLHRLSVLAALRGQQSRNWIVTVHDLHLKYGNVVVLSPNEISVNGDSKFVQDIYVKNFPKSAFYANFGNHGKPNMFASLGNEQHIRFKKILSGLYSKSAVFSPKNTTRGVIINKVGDLVRAVDVSSVTGKEPDIINAKCEDNEHGKGHTSKDGKWFNTSRKAQNLGIDVYSLFASLAMDVVSSFELGAQNGTDLLQRPDKRHIIVKHRQVASMGFWTTLMPRLWNWAASNTILNSAVEIEKWQFGIYSNAEQNIPVLEKDANLTTLEALKKNGFRENAAYSFLSDNIFAGHETTAIQLTYLTYELSRPVNQVKQQKLVRELRETFGVPQSKQSVIDDLEKVDTLPYLNALLEENSRVHSSIPGAEPRVVDKPYPVKVSGNKSVVIPKGTVISCQPYSMHRQEDVFPHGSHFVPERWLQYEDESKADFTARIKRQNKYMMPFGKGVRMCLGMNVALIEMKLAVANLYWHFNSKLCSDWCEITHYEEGTEFPNVIEMGEKFQRKNRTDEEKMVMVDTYTTRPLNDECWLEWYDNE